MMMIKQLILQNWKESYTRQLKLNPATGERMMQSSELSIRKLGVMKNLGKIQHVSYITGASN